MTQQYPRVATLLVLVFLTSTGFGYGTEFSCPLGKQGACLDYLDKVCSSNGKCVSDDAACFEAYTCGIRNEFVCKSDYDNVVSEYDDLVRRHNDLVDELDRAQRKFRQVQTCVDYATDLEDAQSCFW